MEIDSETAQETSLDLGSFLINTGFIFLVLLGLHCVTSPFNGVALGLGVGAVGLMGLGFMLSFKESTEKSF